MLFEWDESKDLKNRQKHGVSFNKAKQAFLFTHRNGKIRVFGAGYWRKGKKCYEEENKIH